MSNLFFDPNAPEIRNQSTLPIPSQRGKRSNRKSSTSAKWQRTMRWLHVYTSMAAFAIILFFGTTGILLNHPSWLFGDEILTTTTEGTLPSTVVSDDGSIEFLAVSEFLRTEHGVSGKVTNFDQIGAEGSINYTGPAYGASARFDVDSLAYDLSIQEEGFANAMRDLHSGSDTGSAWGLAIDSAAIFLVFVSLTGLGIQLFLRKRRRRALLWLVSGLVITLVLIWFTMV